MAKRSRKLTRLDWLRAALRALDEGGLEAVKVLPLSVSLRASRGSFYWHFRNRSDLLQSVLDHWEVAYTDSVIERASEPGGDARKKFLALMRDVLERRQGRFEPAIRAWARHDRHVAAVVRRADRKRLGFITGLFREMGFSPQEAESRGRLALLYLVGDHVVLVTETSAERRRFLRRRHRLLTEDAPSWKPTH